MGCQPANAGSQNCYPVFPKAWNRGGLTPGPGSPSHEIKRTSPRWKEMGGRVHGVGGSANQVYWSGEDGAGLLSLTTHHLRTSPPVLVGQLPAATQHPCALAVLHPQCGKGPLLINEQVS